MHDKVPVRRAARPSSRLAQREDTGRRLLAAARTLFRNHGVETVSMEDIARSAAVSRATIYLHFPGKPTLLTALLEEDWASQIKLFERLQGVDPLDRDQMGEWLNWVVEGMRRARDSFAVHRVAMGQDASLTTKHFAHRTRLAEILRASLARGGADGFDDLTAQVESEFIVAELEYYATAAIMSWDAAQTAAGLERILRRIEEFARQASR